MEALYRMESLCSEACSDVAGGFLGLLVVSSGSVFRTGTVIPFLDNMESFAGTILFCQFIDGTAVTDAR